jgi:transposase InsO family protein
MSWQEQSTVELRAEFVRLAGSEGANVRALCRRSGISPTTGYKWLARYRAEGEAGLADRARRPHATPARTAPAMESAVLDLRDQHPTWGGRKLARRLQDLGAADVPAPSTITAILERHGLIDPAAVLTHRPVQRFEAAAPNEQWQLDFTGPFPLDRGRCHPLPVLDDHSRFLLGLGACADEQGATVQAQLTALFRRYGLPWSLLCDNGPPWGNARAAHALTTLGVWLRRLGVGVVHGRPRHPQTQGKVERLNGTLTVDVLARGRFADLAAAQTAFDGWRATYNEERPHEALALATPLSRYVPSSRDFPETLPEVAYAPDDEVRKVDAAGQISWRGRSWKLSVALAGQPVGVRPTLVDGVVEVRFCQQFVRTLDQRAGPACDDKCGHGSVHHVSEQLSTMSPVQTMTQEGSLAVRQP